jgi:uncharacterized PurR-regulated membrane protein YhhQ (DUF165 family)
MAAIVLLSNVLVQFPLNALAHVGRVFVSRRLSWSPTSATALAGPAVARRVAWVGFAVGLAILGCRLCPAPRRPRLRHRLHRLAAPRCRRLQPASANKRGGRPRSSVPAAASIVDTSLFFGVAFIGTARPLAPRSPPATSP